MGFKDWSYTKKGTIVGAIIGLIGVLIAYPILLSRIGDTFGLEYYLLAPFYLLTPILSLLICGYETNPGCWKAMNYIGALLTILIFSGIGTLIGLIISKIKSSKKK